MREEICSGDVVMSTAGRDRDEIFLVKEVKGKFAFVINGKNKKTGNPKKKSLRHVKLISTGKLISLTEDIKNSKPVGAKRIKSALAKQKNIGG